MKMAACDLPIDFDRDATADNVRHSLTTNWSLI